MLPASLSLGPDAGEVPEPQPGRVRAIAAASMSAAIRLLINPPSGNLTKSQLRGSAFELEMHCHF
jgi:hypothetical protein